MVYLILKDTIEIMLLFSCDVTFRNRAREPVSERERERERERECERECERFTQIYAVYKQR